MDIIFGEPLQDIMDRAYDIIENDFLDVQVACWAVEDTLAEMQVVGEALNTLRNDMSTRLGAGTEPFNRDLHTHGFANMPDDPAASKSLKKCLPDVDPEDIRKAFEPLVRDIVVKDLRRNGSVRHAMKKFC